MNGKKVAQIFAIFSLVQGLALAQEITSETYPPNLNSKVSFPHLNIAFQQKYKVLHSALAIYKRDAIQRDSKESIKRDWNTFFNKSSEVYFDLDHMDIGKRGWTRYYPFSIGENRFIIRIFLTEEYYYQPKVAVLYEGTVENPAVTFQILPGLNSILKDCKIKPHNLYPTPLVDSSS